MVLKILAKIFAKKIVKIKYSNGDVKYSGRSNKRGGTTTKIWIFDHQKTLIWRDFCLFLAIFAYLVRFLATPPPFLSSPAYFRPQSK